MASRKSSNNPNWHRLSWTKKVEICQQGATQEDSLLLTFAVIFIGLEAIFFAAVFSKALGDCGEISIAVLGILLASHFICIFKRIGGAIDRWDAILYDLWGELGKQDLGTLNIKAEEFKEFYKGGYERKELSSKAKRWFQKVKVCFQTLFWWDKNPKHLLIPRRMITTLAPLLVITAWVLVIHKILS